MITIDTDNNNITIIKKDTASLEIALDNYQLTTGDTVIFTIAREVEQETPLVQKTVTIFTAEGRAVINLTTEDTDLDIGSYKYDIQIDTRDGRRDTVIGPAKFKVIGGVTY